MRRTHAGAHIRIQVIAAISVVCRESLPAIEQAYSGVRGCVVMLYGVRHTSRGMLQPFPLLGSPMPTRTSALNRKRTSKAVITDATKRLCAKGHQQRFACRRIFSCSLPRWFHGLFPIGIGRKRERSSRVPLFYQRLRCGFLQISNEPPFVLMLPDCGRLHSLLSTLDCG